MITAESAGMELCKAKEAIPVQLDMFINVGILSTNQQYVLDWKLA